MAAHSEFAGPLCHSEGYSMAMVEAAKPGDVHLTNGIALELFNYKLSNKTSSTEKPTELVYRLCGYKLDAKKFNCVRTHLTRLNKMKKEKRRRPSRDEFLCRVYLHYYEGFLKGQECKEQDYTPTEQFPVEQHHFTELPPSPPVEAVGDEDVSVLPVGNKLNHSICSSAGGNTPEQSRGEESSYREEISNRAEESRTDESSHKILHAKRKRKRTSSATTPYEIDFSILPQEALKRYMDHFNLSRTTQRKQALLSTVARHFSSIPVDETSVTATFLSKVKERRRKDT